MNNIPFNDSALDSLYHRDWDERSDMEDGQDEDLVEDEDEDK